MISLSDALREGRLQDFISQEESRGVEPISEAAFDATASTVIRTPLQDDQTSSSPRPDGSPEK